MSVLKQDGKEKYLKLDSFSKFAKGEDERGEALFSWFK